MGAVCQGVKDQVFYAYVCGMLQTPLLPLLEINCHCTVKDLLIGKVGLG